MGIGVCGGGLWGLKEVATYSEIRIVHQLLLIRGLWAQLKEVIAHRGWEPGTPPRLCPCRASFGCCLCKELVTGRRERGYKHDELTEVHLGISVGIEVLEQSVHSVLVPSALEERGPESGTQVLSCAEWTLAPWEGHAGSERALADTAS